MMRFTILLWVFIFITSCDNAPDPSGEIDQKGMLQNTGENIILPAYSSFLQSTNALKIKADAFVSDPNLDNLEVLKSSWISSYNNWQKVGFYNFGPAEEYGILSINFYPTNVALIEQNINSGNYNLQTAASTFAKGFPALDYLLFGFKNSDEERINEFLNNSNASQYLSDVVSEIDNLANSVYNEWAGGYLATFTANTGTSVGSSLSLLVNSITQYLELHIRNGKVGIPNGNSVVSDQRFGPFPEKSEGYYSRNYTTGFLKLSVEAIRDFYTGRDGEGLHDYLSALNAQDGTLATDYLSLIDDTLTKISNLNENYILETEGNGEKLTSIFNNLKTMVALIKVDIVSALSISITYADNDGD